MASRNKLIIITAIALLAVGMTGVSAAPGDLAAASVSPSAVAFSANGGANNWQLSVSGPGDISFSLQSRGNPPALQLSHRGVNLPDGSYTYELRGWTQGAAPQSDSKANGRGLLVQEGNAVSRGESVSGTVTIRSGRFVAPTEEGTSVRGESSVNSGTSENIGEVNPSTQVILMDLVVQGSECVGFDCSSSPSFGFDTLRLKENNLRVKFDDTSTSASFPNRDWQITINDSANGGANKFSIDDITGGRTPFTIEANAPSNSLFVDDGGRLGLGTATPVVDVHVVSGNTPTLRLEQDGSSGFAPQTWDVAGNEANFFVRDATNGSQLPFKIKPGADSGSLFIAADNDIGIGTESPGTDTDLHIRRTDAAPTRLQVENANGAGQTTAIRLTNASNEWDHRLLGNGNFAITSTAVSGQQLLINGSTGEVTVAGDFTVSGTKNFGVSDPEDKSKWIYFSALEGPEAGTYYRGTARTVDGKAVIEMPDYFSKMTESEGLTVQLTPVGGWHQLYVASKSSEELVIRDTSGTEPVEFDFIVQGIRTGYSDFAVERPAPEDM